VVLADDLIDDRPSVLEQMVEVFERRGRSVIAVQNVTRPETKRYGIIKTDARSKSPHRISGIVEKPEPAVAPSTLGVVGRYLLTPRIFHHLAHGRPGAGGEIQLTDGIAALMAEEDIFALEIKGTRYDCGSKLGYLQATIQYGLRHPEVGADFRKYMLSQGMRLPNGKSKKK
jgi:UTP--glucose-1-phosphate uridylyltransferase